jgi:hypothetical protein
MIALHAHAGPHGLALTNYFASLQDPEVRIDIVRAIWCDQMADTERILTVLQASESLHNTVNRVSAEVS